MQNLLISVIIPVYNAGMYLEKCLDSILRQTYRNIEVILVNDGSKDNSADICNGFTKSDNRVRVLHKSNEGAGAARNDGFGMSEGEWVIFQDSDDFWDDLNGLSKLVQIKKNLNYKVDFIFFSYKRFFQMENLYIDRPDYPSNLVNCRSKNEKVKLLLNNSFIPAAAHGKMIRSDFLRSNEVMFPRVIYSAEDIPWFVEILEKSDNFTFTNLRLNVYRKQVPGSLTNIFKVEKFNNLFNIVESEANRLKSQVKSDELSEILLSFVSYQYVILMAMAANFTGAELKNNLKALRTLDWLLEYNLSDKVRKVKILKRFLPDSIIVKLLGIYSKYIVDRR